VALTILTLVISILLLLSPVLFPIAYEIWRDKKATKWADEVLLRQRDEEHRRHSSWQNGMSITINAPRVHEQENPLLSISIKQKSNLNCPLCLDSVSTDVIMCVKCNTLLHYDCVNELGAGRCPVLGCQTILDGIPKNRAAKREHS